MKDYSMSKMFLLLIVISVLMLCNSRLIFGEEPPALNPFAPPSADRPDAVPGYLELSDGSIHPGLIYLTRDKALKIYDEQLQRQREIPLSAVKQIECTIKKEWREKEWKFQESAKDAKLYTGRSYPAREYEHTLTLLDGRKVSGGLSAIVYLQSQSDSKAAQFILNKRNKGEIGQDLPSLIYVRSIKLGQQAFEVGKQKAIENKTK